MNRYHSFYLEDLENTIRTVAMNIMNEPHRVSSSAEQLNANIALYNGGIRDMARSLIDALEKEAGKTDEV